MDSIVSMRRNCIVYNHRTNQTLVGQQFGGYILFDSYVSQVESLRQ